MYSALQRLDFAALGGDKNGFAGMVSHPLVPPLSAAGCSSQGSRHLDMHATLLHI